MIEHLPTPADHAARRARMGFAPASSPVVMFKAIEPKPAPKIDPATVYVPAEPIANALPASLPDEPPTLGEIKRLVSIVHRIPLTEILSDGRHPALVKARDHIVWLACRHTYKSLPQIGEAIGHRDHTTVLHSLYKTVLARGIVCRGHTRETVGNRVERRRDYMREYGKKRDRYGRYQRADAP